MKLIKFELDKIFRNKFLLIALLFLLVLNGFNIWKDYSVRAEWEKEYYSQRKPFYDVLKGEITTEKVKWLTEQNDYADKLLSGTESDTSKLITDNAYADFNISNEYIDEVRRLYNYNDEVKVMKEKNEIQFDFAQEHTNTFLVNCAKKIDTTYMQRNISGIYNYSQIEEYLDYSFTEFFIIIILLLAFSSVFAAEHETGMYLCFVSSVGGRKKVASTKLAAVSIFTFIVTFLFSVFDTIVFTLCLEIDGFSSPVYALSSYKFTPLICSIGEYIVFLFVVRLIGFLILSVFISLLSSVLKNSYVTFIFSMIIVFLLMALEVYGKNEVGIFSSLNPIKLIVGSDLFSNFGVVNLFNIPVFSYVMSILLGLICFILLCLFVIKVNNKNQRSKKYD